MNFHEHRGNQTRSEDQSFLFEHKNRQHTPSLNSTCHRQLKVHILKTHANPNQASKWFCFPFSASRYSPSQSFVPTGSATWGGEQRSGKYKPEQNERPSNDVCVDDGGFLRQEALLNGVIVVGHLHLKMKARPRVKKQMCLYTTPCGFLLQTKPCLHPAHDREARNNKVHTQPATITIRRHSSRQVAAAVQTEARAPSGTRRSQT